MKGRLRVISPSPGNGARVEKAADAVVPAIHKLPEESSASDDTESSQEPPKVARNTGSAALRISFMAKASLCENAPLLAGNPMIRRPPRPQGRRTAASVTPVYSH